MIFRLSSINYCSPRQEEKMQLAHDIVQAFPNLRDGSATGYVCIQIDIIQKKHLRSYVVYFEEVQNTSEHFCVQCTELYNFSTFTFTHTTKQKIEEEKNGGHHA